MMIKDLESSKELARDELAAVRGGFNVGYVGGQQANQLVAGGGILSPTTAVNAPVNAPVLVQMDNDPATLVDIDTTNVLASVGTLVF
ncbi:MAG: hypothetical protein WCZ87_05700 [Thiohalobacteraceae bacterium]